MNFPSHGTNSASPPLTLYIVPDGPRDPALLRASLAGRSLLARCLDHCKGSNAARVLVGTSDSETAQFARTLDVEVILRARPITTSSRRDAVLAMLDTMRELEPAETGLVLTIDPFAPIVTPRHINAAAEVLATGGVRAVTSVARIDERIWSAAEGRDPRAIEGSAADQFVRETGVIYGVHHADLARAGELLSHHPTLLDLTREVSFVVSTPTDLATAAAMLDADRTRDAIALLKDIKLLVLDFDGVFTDNRVLVMQDGTEGVLCSRGDGMGLEMLRKSGLPIFVLSKEQNPVVAARCRKLKLDWSQGVDDKLPELKRIAERAGAMRHQVAYVGNDTNDLGPMGWVGVPIAVGDAHPDALAAARLVLTKAGGFGALRELCDLLIEARRMNSDPKLA